MIICIGGCRDFTNYHMLEQYMDNLIKTELKNDEITIISGGCRGTDYLAEQYAKRHGYQFKEYPANWSLYGKAAGPIRNEEMVKQADVVIAFWDNKSRGTKTLINFAKQYNKKLYVKQIV